MEITIKSLRVIKEGMQRDGKTEYKWVSVMADDGSEKGTEYTTFDKAVLKEKPGAVLDIGEIEIKGGKLSFKKVVKVISKGSGPDIATEKTNGGDMSKEEWERKQRIERDSFEAQTAYKGALSLIVGIEPPPDYTKELIDAAISWGLKALKASPASAVDHELIKAEAVKSKPLIDGSLDVPVHNKREKAEPDQEIPCFKTGIELVNYAMNERGMPMTKIRADLGIANPSDIKDVAAATKVLFPDAKVASELLF